MLVSTSACISAGIDSTRCWVGPRSVDTEAHKRVDWGELEKLSTRARPRRMRGMRRSQYALARSTLGFVPRTTSIRSFRVRVQFGGNPHAGADLRLVYTRTRIRYSPTRKIKVCILFWARLCSSRWERFVLADWIRNDPPRRPERREATRGSDGNGDPLTGNDAQAQRIAGADTCARRAEACSTGAGWPAAHTQRTPEALAFLGARHGACGRTAEGAVDAARVWRHCMRHGTFEVRVDVETAAVEGGPFVWIYSC
ncbi:hypothetical protein C8R43DRAFT_127443 [Mycena crocata]|nr:hypothetical protein C8R43DRAFT_127443 [Mycena crocata]